MDRLSYGVGIEILLSYDEIEGVNSRRLYFLFIRLLCRRLKNKLFVRKWNIKINKHQSIKNENIACTVSDVSKPCDPK